MRLPHLQCLFNVCPHTHHFSPLGLLDLSVIYYYIVCNIRCFAAAYMTTYFANRHPFGSLCSCIAGVHGCAGTTTISRLLPWLLCAEECSAASRIGRDYRRRTCGFLMVQVSKTPTAMPGGMGMYGEHSVANNSNGSWLRLRS